MGRPFGLPVLFICIGLAGVAHAADGTAVEPLLAKAERAYATLAYDEALQTAQQVLKGRRLSHEQLVRATRLLTLANGALGHESAARDAALLLVMYQPTFEVDRDVSPKVRAPIMEARLYWKDQPLQPGIEVTPALSATSAGALRIELRDPQRAVEKVAVGFRWGVAAEYNEKTLAPARSMRVDIPRPPSGTGRLEYWVQAMDSNENVVFQHGTEDEPKTSLLVMESAPRGPNSEAPQGKSIFASPWFWGAAAVLVGGGVTAAVVATRPAEEVLVPARSSNLFGSLTCGGAACN